MPHVQDGPGCGGQAVAEELGEIREADGCVAGSSGRYGSRLDYGQLDSSLEAG